MYLRYFVIKPWPVYWTNSKSTSHKNATCQVRLNWPSSSGGKEFPLCFFAISLLSLLGKRHGPSFEQTWKPSFQWCLCQVWLNLPVVLNFFFISSMYFLHDLSKESGPSFEQTWIFFSQWCFETIKFGCYFVINSPWERTLETLHPSIHQSILRA